MTIATDISGPRIPGNARARLTGGDAECDLCGRAVRREIAFERVEGAGDAVEIVVVCRDCELGAD